MNEPAVMKHLDILQSIITRMANNSASCKTWNLTVITGLIAFSMGNQNIPLWISIIPSIMFFALDSFYLGLERHFIDLQKDFVKKLETNTLKIEDIYVIKSKRSFCIHLEFIFNGMISFSTTFVYIPIIILITLLCLEII